MHISVSDAKAQLTDLVRRAESGEEIVLTRHGHAVARLSPVARLVSSASRRTLLEAQRASAQATLKGGPDAARSQDFLYDDDGMPS